MRLTRTLLVAALGLAPFAGTAHAGTWHCYGTQNVGVVCYQTNVPTVNPYGSSYDDCIWIGTKCVPVSVPIPTVTNNGPIVDYACGGPSWQCA
jgi:hypothetical protein